MNKNNGCKFKLVDKNKKRKSIGYKETYQKKKKKKIENHKSLAPGMRNIIYPAFFRLFCLKLRNGDYKNSQNSEHVKK